MQCTSCCWSVPSLAPAVFPARALTLGLGVCLRLCLVIRRVLIAPQLSEYEREKERQKKKDGKIVINTKSQAVAATAVGVSWLTAGILTGGLVVAGTMVAAGVTVGSMGGEKNEHAAYRRLFPQASPVAGAEDACACVPFAVAIPTRAVVET